MLSYIVISLKFIIPILFLFFPFPALWANYFLDIVDGDILQHLGLTDYTYQTVDKSADLFSYFFMLFLGMRWKINKTVINLFSYRLIGQLLFFITRNELMFFYFQNFLEPLMLVYGTALFYFKSETKTYAWYKKHLLIIWIGILAYKIWNEWYLHFANIDLSLMFLGFNGGSP